MIPTPKPARLCRSRCGPFWQVGRYQCLQMATLVQKAVQRPCPGVCSLKELKQQQGTGGLDGQGCLKSEGNGLHSITLIFLCFFFQVSIQM